jgi:hypothetical protein
MEQEIYIDLIFIKNYFWSQVHDPVQLKKIEAFFKNPWTGFHFWIIHACFSFTLEK